MLELLQKYPIAADVMKSYYLNIMLESLNDNSLPDNFKEYVREKGIDDDKIAKIMEGSPRNLFDVFDENGLFIETLYMEGNFHYTITNGENTITSNPSPIKTRKECDRAVIEVALELLNNKLCEQTQL
jgi:hypothetical protein